jgi:hypothetical protein
VSRREAPRAFHSIGVVALSESRGENGYTLTVGVGPKSCAQYALSNGELPYWVAVGTEVENERDEEVEFMAGGTALPK